MDSDEDGVPDDQDNCPDTFNPDQANVDGDEFGDLCDPCNSAPEICDGDDNDCDGLADEDFEGLGLGCTVGVGLCAREGNVECTEDGEGVFCDGEAGPAAEEICDGEDNDCDGNVDEGVQGCCVPGDVQPCGSDEGRCVSGEQRCGPDQRYGECSGVGPQDERCDGEDDDCDGLTDEGTLNACGRCGPVPQEICDGQDNDCDGQIDEAFPALGDPCAVGIGECAGVGVYVCDGADQVTCSGAPRPPSVERCDGLDNDCDGEIDEEFELGGACVLGVGLCAREGVVGCGGNGQPQCLAEQIDPQPELCDGEDNDCDGDTDEDFPHLGAPCDAGEGQCAAEGVFACEGGAAVCDAEPQAPQIEQCNGVDDDCDGLTDETFPAEAQGCQRREGQCVTEGQLVCRDGGVLCDAPQPIPEAEICDEEDNDCDGQVDEGLGCVICTDEVCDGEDNDCDGQVDEGLAEICVVAIGVSQEGDMGSGLGDRLVAFDDINGDGVPDAVAAAPRSDRADHTIVALSGADGSTLWSRELNGEAGTSLAVGDFGGNGRRLAVGAPDAWNGVFDPRGRIYFISAANELLLTLQSQEGERIGEQILAGQFGGLAPDDLALGDRRANDDGGRLSTIEFNPSPNRNTLGSLTFGQDAELGERIFTSPIPRGDGLDDLLATARFEGDRVLLAFDSQTLGFAGPIGGLVPPTATDGSFAEDVAAGRWAPGAPITLAVGAPRASAYAALPGEAVDEAGVIYFYNLEGEAFASYTAGVEGAEQGQSLAALPRPDDAADALAVGAANLRRVDVLHRATGAVRSISEDSDGFGKTLIITEPGADGTRRLFVGAPDHRGDRGHVYVYSIR